MAETSVFEQARMTHEEIEQYEDALVDTLINPPNSSSRRLNMHWKLVTSELLDKLVGHNQALSNMYADSDHERITEWESLGRQDDTNREEGAYAEFYARLGKIQDYYKRYPENAVVLQTSATPSILARGEDLMSDVELMDRQFTGEEMSGRFVDLNEYYERYINLKGVARISYLEYLARLDRMCGVDAGAPMSTKRTEAYHTYLQGLRNYLSNFLHKSRPLEDMDALEIRAVDFFESNWDQGKVPGWETKEHALYPETSTGEQGGIWCEACQRSYAKQTVYDAHLSSARHLKMAERAKNGGNRPTVRNTEDVALKEAKQIAKAKALARDEVVIQALARELATVRDDTRSNIERRAALTDRERQDEADALEAEQEEAMATGGMGYERAIEKAARDRDTSEKAHNPLKLPLGWDGKPIPFWMYKVQGLSVEYPCEICSDFVYRGRKVFEKHFQEARHTFGMRALGLPNTAQFRDVTRIQDAFALYEKLKQQQKLEQTDDGDTEEIEDEHGNAYTRKTYELLKKQGLL
ncbi:DNA ligase (ATP) [Malassezia yamatoensis]|uniref:DNA ligase (ATP) n=1 Tax=Malassezia yamatoensis TaxID=253288 RepID=A0AAJ5YUU2_9BASI|nr:DNA ligase (ATP) [Malassezia yamatoensis]